LWLVRFAHSPPSFIFWLGRLMVINHTTYRMGGSQSHNLWNRRESISQLIEWVVINLITYGMGGKQSHNLWNGWW
jgi:hypothetical protein